MAKTSSFDLDEVIPIVERAARRWSIRMKVEYDDLFQEIMVAWFACKADVNGLDRWIFGKAKQKASDLFNAEQQFRHGHRFVYTNAQVEDLLYLKEDWVIQYVRGMSNMHQARLFGYYVDGRTVEGQSKEYQAVRYSLTCLTNLLNIEVSGMPKDNRPGARKAVSIGSGAARIEQDYSGERWSSATSGTAVTW